MPTIPHLIDSHCHLDYAPMSEDVDGTLARARAAGVEQLVHIGCQLGALDPAVELATRHACVFTSLGIHPHDATTAEDETLARVQGLAEAHRDVVVGIGETGLDYHYNYSPPEVQQRGFARHIELARNLDLPLILHIRDAHADAWAIVDAQPARPVPGIVHCFTGTPAEAREWLRRGWHISFSGIATFSSARPVLEAARECPEDRILLETDAPFLAPQPMRGRKNEPAFVAFTCAIVAAARGQSPEALALATTANARRVFGLPSPASG